MSKFRSIPRTVEAEQFHGFYHTPYPPGVGMEDNSNDPTKERYQFFILNSHGDKVYIQAGDWIITEPEGLGYSACGTMLFEAKYEKV